jgi:N-acetyl-gamma-glutamyl-phosphate reductase
MKPKLPVAIVGGSGYTGMELLRLLIRHPQVEVAAVTSSQYAGREVGKVFPHLKGETSLIFLDHEVDRVADSAELIFTAVPHEKAMDLVARLHQKNRKVVDLSADFRFREASVYEAWYQPHRARDLLKKAVYGLPEFYREAIRKASIVGNPGCYPTSVLLALAPLLKAPFINSSGIIADSKSGASGAGRGLALGTLFCEVDEGFQAYKVAGHRHTPEIEQELAVIAGKEIRIVFTPHLVPMSRGILSTLYVPLTDLPEAGVVYGLFEAAYQKEPFVRLCPPDQLPNTLQVRGSNYCDLGFKMDPKNRMLIVVSALDNLIKGASGQAVQNMNLMLGFEETAGLEQLPLYP